MEILQKEPETPEELAAFKSANSKKRKVNMTTLNLVLALAATLLATMLLVFMVVRPQDSILPSVDFSAASTAAKSGYSKAVITPELPEGWYYNAANVRTSDEDRQKFWYLGIITPKPNQEFIALNQRIDADDTWLIRMMDSHLPTGERVIDGVTWIEFDYLANKESSGNKKYGIGISIAGSTVLLHGTASPENFELIAKQVTDQLGSN